MPSPMSRLVGGAMVPLIRHPVKRPFCGCGSNLAGGHYASPMDEERIGLFIDYENLAIGARDDLGMTFDFKPVADALAERGRVVVRRAYADWTLFAEDRKDLTRHHIELIEIPQRMGASRKNAADIKMAVDAMELAFERDYITTFVIGTGDSDFTPLVYKLRELNKRVIGVGVKASTSALLPPACDEFLFYETLFEDATIERLCAFLGVGFVAGDYEKSVRQGGSGAMSPEQKARIGALVAMSSMTSDRNG